MAYAAAYAAYGRVAPLAGAWIETPNYPRIWIGMWSRPSRARGLKRRLCNFAKKNLDVAPLAGAWIETMSSVSGCNPADRRAPRGRVD